MEREKLTQLVAAAQAGDNTAIGELFNAFQNTVYNIALRETKDPETAADVTQETFIEVIQTIGKLQEPAAFVTWLKTIVYHQCTRYYRKKENKHESLVEEREDAPVLFDTLEEENEEFIPDKAMESEEFRRTIRAFIDKLPDVQRSAIMMKYFDDLSVKEIAAVQGVSENTVLSRLYYGRNAIKAEVEAYEKKHDTKLHAIPFLPMFRLLFNESPAQMPPAAAAATAQAVSAATGVSLAVTTGTAAGVAGAATAVGAGVGGAATAVAAGVGVAVKAAAIPLTVKIVAGVLAAVVAITAPIVIHRAVENRDDTSDGDSHYVEDDEWEGTNHPNPTGPNSGDDTIFDPNDGMHTKRGGAITPYLTSGINQQNAADMLFAHACFSCPAQYYDTTQQCYVVPEEVMWDMACTFYEETVDTTFTEQDFWQLKEDGPYFFGEYRDGVFLLRHNPADVALTSYTVIEEENVMLLFFSYEGDEDNRMKSYCMVGYQYDGDMEAAEFSVDTDADGWYFRCDDSAILDSLQLGYIQWTPYSLSAEGILGGGNLGLEDILGWEDMFGEGDLGLGDIFGEDLFGW